jgi:hypothetical protein
MRDEVDRLSALLDNRPEPALEDAREGGQDPGDSPPVDPIGESGPPPEEPRTPLGSDGVPYHPDDPRFPDVWGAHPRSPFARLIR